MAGHIDHGKSALVEALTGRPMDPHAEERRRGITLDLHFAPLRLDDGRTVGVVDVPGHEDLIRTMVAGASGMDLVLLVVAADEGPMPQTREHLLVAEALGLRRGIAVLSKADLASGATAGERLNELEAWLRRSSVDFGPPIAVSARSGAGLAELRRRITETPEGQRGGTGFRLPIDRVFSVAGAGTVVTGTAWSGTVRTGDRVTLLPGGEEARVRSVQRFGVDVGAGSAGERVAVALAGIDRAAAARGDTLVGDPADWCVTDRLDALVELATDAGAPLRTRQRVRLLLGTAEVMARVTAARAVAPGSQAPVRLALEKKLVTRGGDRFVLRAFSPMVTLGGGLVVDPAPPARTKPADLATGTGLLATLVRRRRDGIPLAELERLTGRTGADVAAAIGAESGVTLVEGVAVASDRLAALISRAQALVDAEQGRDPGTPGLRLEALRAGLRTSAHLADRVIGAAGLVIEGAYAHRPGFTPTAPIADPESEALVARIVGAGLTAPTLPELAAGAPARDALSRSVDAGRLVPVTRDWYVAREAIDQFASVLRELGARGPITVGALRDRLGLTRKYLIPLLEWADRSGVTIRQGDVRVVPPSRA